MAPRVRSSSPTGLHELPLTSRADQEEREHAIRAFKGGTADVMVATDLASKGLDFPDIKHVINYDMPEDIENYGSQLLSLARSVPRFASVR